MTIAPVAIETAAPTTRPATTARTAQSQDSSDGDGFAAQFQEASAALGAAGPQSGTAAPQPGMTKGTFLRVPVAAPKAEKKSDTPSFVTSFLPAGETLPTGPLTFSLALFHAGQNAAPDNGNGNGKGDSQEQGKVAAAGNNTAGNVPAAALTATAAPAPILATLVAGETAAAPPVTTDAGTKDANPQDESLPDAAQAAPQISGVQPAPQSAPEEMAFAARVQAEEAATAYGPNAISAAQSASAPAGPNSLSTAPATWNAAGMPMVGTQLRPTLHAMEPVRASSAVEAPVESRGAGAAPATDAVRQDSTVATSPLEGLQPAPSAPRPAELPAIHTQDQPKAARPAAENQAAENRTNGPAETKAATPKVEATNARSRSGEASERQTQDEASSSNGMPLKKAADASPAVSGHAMDSTMPAQNVATTSDPNADSTPGPAPAAATARTAVVHTPAAAENQGKPTEALKDISLQVGPGSNDKVQVRMVEQAGELRIAVHTDDTDLAHGLRQGLPDLVGRLQDNGFRAEAWRPAGATPALTATPESKNADNNTHNGDSQPQGWSQQSGGGQQNQNQNHFNRPRWVEEMESSLTGKGESIGAFHGISS